MSIASIDQDSPLFSEMDIETLHNQLLEAAASVDYTAQPLVEVWEHGFLSSDVHPFDDFDSMVIPAPTDHTIEPITVLVENIVSFGESMNELGRFTFRTDSSIGMRVNNGAIPESVSYDGDVDFAYVRPQAVEYHPAIPADYTTAIPSIYTQMDKQLRSIMKDDGSEEPLDMLTSSPIDISPSTSSTRRIVPLPRRTSSLAFNPRTPPLRVVEGNVGEVQKRTSRKRKVQAFHLVPVKKAKRASLASPTPKGRTVVSVRAVGEFVCPVEGCGKVCTRIGDLNRHRQSRTHQLPSFSCPLGCGKMFSRKDAAKRHSETDKCPTFRLV